MAQRRSSIGITLLFAAICICVVAVVLVTIKTAVRADASSPPLSSEEPVVLVEQMTASPIAQEYFKRLHDLETRIRALGPPNDGTHPIFPYPVYYINMDSSPARDRFMREQFAYHGINDVTRIPAIDGRTVYPTNLGEKHVASNLIVRGPELGCTLSHIKAIAQAYDNGDQRAIILEDDAYFKHARLWPKRALEKIVERAPRGWNLLNLMCHTFLCAEPFARTDYVLYEPPVNCFITSAYIINRQGMKHVLDHVGYTSDVIQLKSVPNIHHTTDSMVFYWAGVTYFVKPSTFFVYNDGQVIKSAIQPGSDLELQQLSSLDVLRLYT